MYVLTNIVEINRVGPLTSVGVTTMFSLRVTPEKCETLLLCVVTCCLEYPLRVSVVQLTFSTFLSYELT